MFSPFQEFLKKAISHHGMHDIVEAAQVCAKFAQLKDKIFPEDSVNELSARHFKNGALTINVPNSVWAHEVISRKNVIITELNTKFGQTVIDRIRTELIELPAQPEAKEGRE